MTIRIYLRWPDQRVSNKTVTDSEPVAAFAFAELKEHQEHWKARGAFGIVFSRDGKQAEYVELNEDSASRPDKSARRGEQA
jgi:hypothetical protein